MRIYNYLLFRIYMFYYDSTSQKVNYTFYTSIVSTVLLGFNILTIIGLLFINYRFNIDILSNKIFTTFFSILLWSINYFCFIKNEGFLKKGFVKDNVGTFYVLLYVFLTFAIFIFTALKVREIIMVK